MADANTEVRVDLLPRLQAVGREYADAKERTALLLRQRNELIVEAVDEGMHQRAIVRAVGLKAQSQVVAICASSQPDAAQAS
jgi:hypothetical protein